MLKCDFCSAPNPKWKHVTPDFTVGVHDGYHFSSHGFWAACEVCNTFIMRGEQMALSVRSLDTLLKASPEMTPYCCDLFVEMEELHRKFFAFRRGEPGLIAEAAA